jgi:hypothetical protein
MYTHNNTLKMEDWGTIGLKQIDTGDDFWALLTELCDDDSGFLHNKSTIVEAFKDGKLYGLSVCESQKMYERFARWDSVFCRETYYLLPCFCIKHDKTAIIIWTHTRARRMGFAKKLVELLHIEHAWNPLSDSLEFWTKCDVTPVDVYPC